ncbi:MAG: DUF4339 domain-containing protein, partial [Planctomycetota bacterium]
MLVLGFFYFSGVSFLSHLIIGFIAAFVASSKGRNAVGWFLLCFFSGFIVPFSNVIFLIVLLILSDLHESEGRHAAEATWRRRHHESFEEERTVNKRFRDHVVKRLDRQDEALGLPPLKDSPIAAPAPPREIVTYPMMGNGSWYLVIQGREEGPFPEKEIIAMLERKEINGDTYAWSEGMQDWQRAERIGNFNSH